MTTLYISGPISGIADGNRPAFDAAAVALGEAGFDTMNPHDLGDAGSWMANLRRDLVWILSGVRVTGEGRIAEDRDVAPPADGIATLPDWENSNGARLEVTVATALWLPVQPLHYWVAYGVAPQRMTRQ